MIRRLLTLLQITALLLPGALASVHAAETAAPPPAERLVELLGVREQITRTAAELAPLVRNAANQVAADYPSGEERSAHHQAIEARLTAFVGKLISWENLGPVYVDAYREIYSAAEIDALVEFLESPLGQRFLNEQPKLAAKVGETMQRILPELLEGVQAEVANFRAEHPAEGGDHHHHHSCTACDSETEHPETKDAP